MTTDDFIKGKVAEAAWKSGHHLSLAACLTIMLIIRNRVREDGDWIGAMDGLPIPDIKIDTRAPHLRSVLEMVDAVYDYSRADNLTNGATYWSEVENTSRFDTATRDRVGNVGSLILWK